MVKLPTEASAALPSRGMSYLIGKVNGEEYCTAVEPDGEDSHWFRVDDSTLESIRLAVGQIASFEFETTKIWPEPKLPTDLINILEADPQAMTTWKSLTSAARWDWIRWLSAPRLPETRARRVESIPSRFRSGKRRPCCFNRNECTLTKA